MLQVRQGETGMKLYHPDNSALFYKIMAQSPMMQDASSRSLLGLLMINKPMGITGMAVRWDILKKQKLILTKADLELTAPLFIYDLVTRQAMREITNKMLISKDLNEFHTKLSPLGRCYVYAQVKAALAYYDATLSSLLMIPDVKFPVFSNGFYKLKDLRYGIEKLFRPQYGAATRLRYKMPNMWNFKEEYDMVWYLCHTDLAWTRVFVQALKSSAGGILTPLKYLVQVVELFLQGCFNTYVSGIDKLAHGEPLSVEEYTMLKMFFETDLKTYEEFAWYYYRCNILPDEFFEPFEVFISSVSLMAKKVDERGW